MFSFTLNQVLFFLFFHGHDCERRIEGGEKVNEKVPKSYVVYLLKAALSPQTYDGWLCGGAIVSEYFIVTSAACVTDVQHLYAIAGYKDYVKDIDIYNNQCTKNIKKKIVLICTPKDYELGYTKQEKWSNIDIAVVKVESPYVFSTDAAPYVGDCSYTPGKIDINYDTKYQMPGIDAIVLGWGHEKVYREENDITDLNQPQLMYASTLIEDKEVCKKEYEVYPGMGAVIDKYMICTNTKGNLDDAGVTILKGSPTAKGCEPSPMKLMNHQSLHGEVSCENPDGPEDHVVLVENSRKDIKLNLSRNDSDQKSHNSALMNKTISNSRRSNTRRHGICQNDHGGPLVTWVGAHEMLIGVASAYIITASRECSGPYLYTSTQCNGFFLDCILKDDPTRSNEDRRRICSSLLNEQGLQLVEKHISWENHPDGPAENEKNGTTPVSAVNDTSSVPKNDIKTQVPPAENEKMRTIPISAANNANSVSKNDTKETPNVPPAENERNGTIPASAVNDTSSVPKNDTKTQVPPAEMEKNGTIPISAVNNTNSVSKNETKATPKVPPAEMEKNGNIPISAANNTNSVSKNDTKATPKVPPAENEKNGTTPVSAVNNTNSVSNNDTKATPKVP